MNHEKHPLHYFESKGLGFEFLQARQYLRRSIEVLHSSGLVLSQE